MNHVGQSANAGALSLALAVAFLAGSAVPAQTQAVAKSASVQGGAGHNVAAAAGHSADSQRAAELKQADLRISFWQGQVARDPDNHGSYDRLAAAYAQKARETGDIAYFELAETALAASLKLESTHEDAAPAYTQLAAIHLAEHKFREAGEDADRAIALMPNDLAAYPSAGDAQLEQGNYEAAERYFSRIRQSPNGNEPDGVEHPGIQFLATSHGAGLDWIRGDRAKANEDLQRAVRFGRAMHLPAENIAWTEFMLGEQFFQAGELAAAEDAEAASLQDFPRYHRALAAMGQIRAAQERFAEAEAFYQDAIAIIPLPLYLAALGDIYTASGNSANAAKQYKTVEFIGRLNEINQQVYNRELALFYADHDRNLPEALALARKEFEVRQDIYTSDALAWALLKNGQPALAKVEMERALRLGTVDAMLEFHAGMIEAALGDHASAKMHLEGALAINPRFHVIFAEQARKRLADLQTRTMTVANTAPTGAAHAN